MKRPALPRRAVLAAIGAAGIAATLPRTTIAQQLLPVNVGGPIDDGLTPVIYGLHASLFKRAGLDVQLQFYSSGAALTAALIGGAVDIGKTQLFSLIAAYQHDFPVKIVAGAAQYNTDAPSSALIVAKDSPIVSAADFHGKTIASSALLSVDAIAARAWVDQHGGDSSQVNFIELAMPTMAAAVESGRVTGATPANPMLQLALDSGKVRSFAPVYDAIGKHFLIAAWIATDAYIAKKKETARRFAEAVYGFAAFTNAHPAATAELLAGYAHMSPDVVRRMNRTQNATSVDPAAIEPSIAADVKYGGLPRGFPGGELLAKLT